MQISDLAGWVGALRRADPLRRCCSRSCTEPSTAIVEIGLGYLSLDRAFGHALRVARRSASKMIRQLGSSLTDVTYVFDEPTTGLHPHDIARMNDLLLRLRDKGNTVLVVEHKPETIAIADHVVDLGPRCWCGGRERGASRARSTDCAASDTITGRHFDDRASLEGVGADADGGTLSDPRCRHPQPSETSTSTSRWVCWWWSRAWPDRARARSMHGTLARSARTRRRSGGVDRSGCDPGVATKQPGHLFSGLLEPIRKAFAKANGVKPALFSANSEGACPTCGGRRSHLHRFGDDGRRRDGLRGLRRKAVRRVRARVPPRRE